MRRYLPAGTVTFLFTDVEGSTKLLHELGAEAYAEKLAEHRRLVRQACTARGGVEVDTQGDAFFVAFPTAPEALEAARSITEELASGPITLRIGLHTGTPLLTEEGYVGEDVHFAARVAASAHGGQVVLSSATRALIDEHYSLRELGEHRLKDIPQPVAIFQLGDRQFPPLKTISNANLPRPASSFVGRARELSELLARIEEGQRLVTLTGPGGSGKTRLALEAAATLVPEYKAGVFWVGLAPLRDPALVTETIAQTLGAKDGLAEHIGEREMLLLLDNFEQVIEAAPELSSLLQGCPNLNLLITSRELLRVEGETEHSVPPLEEAEAVSLFCERAQLKPSAEITDLCRRLDNLPLAVELAAARTKAFSPRQILEHLSRRLDVLKGRRDADPRQQTLRATIEWSYDLLGEDEQELFRRLSVFSGGSTLEGAEEVCGADLDILQSLVEKNLLRFSNERYWMLETIREYAAQKLTEAEAVANLKDAHGQWFLTLAKALAPTLMNPESLDQIEVDHGNFRAALHHFTYISPQSHLELANALARFWWQRGYLNEGRTWLEGALANAAPDISLLRANALHQAEWLASSQGDDESAQKLAEEALVIYRALGEDQRAAFTLNTLGVGAAERGDLPQAEQYYEQARSFFVEHGVDLGVAMVNGNMGELALQRGHPHEAVSFARAALDLSRQAGFSEGVVGSLHTLGVAAFMEDDLEQASHSLEEALRFASQFGYRELLASCLDAVAAVARRKGRAEHAASLFGFLEVFRAETGIPGPRLVRELHAHAIAELEDELGSERMSDLATAGRTMNVDEAVDLALSSLRAREGAESQ